MFEDTVIDDRDVDNGEGENETSHDTEEEELVAPDIMHPLGVTFLRVGLHLEEAVAQVHHLPGKEEGEPGHAGEGSGTGTENCVAVVGLAGVVVMSVTALGEIAVAPSEHDEGECRQTEGSHPDSVDEGVNDDFPGEDTLFLWVVSQLKC